MRGISREEVWDIMALFFDEELLEEAPILIDRLWVLLHESQRRGKEPGELYQELKDALFHEIHTLTRGTMVVREQGVFRRISMAALAEMADALLEPVFARYPRTQDSFEQLNSFAMRHTSLAALKFLYLYYRQFTSPMNIDIYKRVIRENFDQAQYEQWLH